MYPFLVGVDGNRLVGTFAPFVWGSFPGAVPGAWDLDEGRLVVAAQRCEQEVAAVSDDTLWFSDDQPSGGGRRGGGRAADDGSSGEGRHVSTDRVASRSRESRDTMSLVAAMS